eukprot:s2142_g4.t1
MEVLEEDEQREAQQQAMMQMMFAAVHRHAAAPAPPGCRPPMTWGTIRERVCRGPPGPEAQKAVGEGAGLGVGPRLLYLAWALVLALSQPKETLLQAVRPGGAAGASLSFVASSMFFRMCFFLAVLPSKPSGATSAGTLRASYNAAEVWDAGAHPQGFEGTRGVAEWLGQGSFFSLPFQGEGGK